MDDATALTVGVVAARTGTPVEFVPESVLQPQGGQVTVERGQSLPPTSATSADATPLVRGGQEVTEQTLKTGASGQYAHVKAPEKADVANYDERQYNDYGWTRVHGILSAAENAQWRSYFADNKKLNFQYTKTSTGEYIIPVGKYGEKLVYSAGTFDNPQITKVIEIFQNDSQTIAEIGEEIIFHESSTDGRAHEIILNMEEEGILRTNSSGDIPNYREIKNVGTARTSSFESGGNRGKRVNGSRSVVQDSGDVQPLNDGLAREELHGKDAKGETFFGGLYDRANGRILLNADAVKRGQMTVGAMLDFVLKHELTHKIETAGAWDTIAKLAREDMGAEAFDAAVKAVQEERAAVGDTVGATPDGAKKEVIANWVGDNLYKKGFAQLIAKKNKGLANNLVMTFAQTRRFLARTENGQQAARMRYAEQLYLKALADTVGDVTPEQLADRLIEVLDTMRERENGDVSAAEAVDGESAQGQYSVAYMNAPINDDVLSLVEKVQSGNYKDNEVVRLNKVSNETAKKIQDITGIDVTGWDVLIEARQLAHIIKRHGEHGQADRSMADATDIAKVEYVLENADEIVDGGNTKAYVESSNGKMRSAKTVVYQADIGGRTYFAVEAVPNTARKAVFVVSTYINKKTGNSQSTDTYSPDVDVQNELATNPANSTISQEDTGSQDYSMQNSAKNSTTGQRGIEDAALYGTTEGESAQGQYSIINSFYAEYDAWDKKDARKVFTVGKTSEVLKSIGVNDAEIKWDASKIIKIKAKHAEMTDTIIKQVPQILENPIAVFQSLQSDSRITLFGEVYAGGKPVLAILELNPMSRQGISLNELKLASAYAKDSAQNFINRSQPLYIDSNKKRVTMWEKRTRLQLPVGSSVGDSTSSISNSSENVNSQNKNHSPIDGQRAIMTPERSARLRLQQREIDERARWRKGDAAGVSTDSRGIEGMIDIDEEIDAGAELEELADGDIAGAELVDSQEAINAAVAKFAAGKITQKQLSEELARITEQSYLDGREDARGDLDAAYEMRTQAAEDWYGEMYDKQLAREKRYERKEAELKERKERYWENRRSERASQEQTRVRDMLAREAGSLVRTLKKPTKEHHIPAEMVKPASDLGGAIIAALDDVDARIEKLRTKRRNTRDISEAKKLDKRIRNLQALHSKNVRDLNILRSIYGKTVDAALL